MYGRWAGIAVSDRPGPFIPFVQGEVKPGRGRRFPGSIEPRRRAPAHFAYGLPCRFGVGLMAGAAARWLAGPGATPPLCIRGP